MSRKKVARTVDLSGDSQRVFDVLNEEQDLAVVLIGTSWLDACLESVLRAYFVESSISEKLLDPRSGALGTFGARMDAAYVLGLISPRTYTDLTRVAEIRNEFAHEHLLLTFADPRIAQACASLDFVDRFYRGVPGQLGEVTRQPRIRFVLTVVHLGERLLLQALGVERRTQLKEPVVDGQGLAFDV